MLENLNIPTWFIDTAMFVFRVKNFLNLFVISPSLCLFLFQSAFFPFNPVACPSCNNNMEAVCSGGHCIIITIQGASCC